jgi:hypothetical protein
MDPLFIIFLALFIPGLLTLILIVAVALPRAVRDQERLKHNLCMHCGYDLRASADGVCPECGQFASEIVRPAASPPPAPPPPVGDEKPAA